MPTPYLKSMTCMVPSAMMMQSPRPKPSFTYLEKSSRCSIITVGSGQVFLISATVSITKEA